MENIPRIREFINPKSSAEATNQCSKDPGFHFLPHATTKVPLSVGYLSAGGLGATLRNLSAFWSEIFPVSVKVRWDSTT